MLRDVDCQVFEDQLDALVRGDLPEEGMRQLRIHADMCPQCAIQLKVQEHLVGPSLEELEDQVPEEMLQGMWDRVESHVAPKARRPGFRWLVPTLAAASLTLLFSTGYLAMETRRLSGESAGLAQQVEEQQGWMAELEAAATSADPVVRTAALAGRNPFTRALSREESISISSLQGLLERMPGDRMILSRAQMDAVLRNRAGLSQPLFRELLAGIDARDGVQARDLIRALDAAEVSPGLMVPTADLLEILS